MIRPSGTSAPVWRPLLAWSGACPPFQRDSLPSCRRGSPHSDRRHRTFRHRLGGGAAAPFDCSNAPSPATSTGCCKTRNRWWL